MATYALDASTLLASVLTEAHSTAALSFLQNLTRRDSLVGPGLLLPECISNLREEVFYRRISFERGNAAVAELLSLDIEQFTDQEHNGLAWRYAADLRTAKAYDAHYLAVAYLRHAELVTIDSGMYQGAVNLKIPARLLR